MLPLVEKQQVSLLIGNSENVIYSTQEMICFLRFQRNAFFNQIGQQSLDQQFLQQLVQEQQLMQQSAQIKRGLANDCQLPCFQIRNNQGGQIHSLMNCRRCPILSYPVPIFRQQPLIKVQLKPPSLFTVKPSNFAACL